MLEYNSEIYINKETSKSVIESIVQNNIIDYKKLNIHKYTQKIEELRKEYLKYKNNKVNNPYKYYVFWEIVKKKFNDSKISLIKRDQKTKTLCVLDILPDIKTHIAFSCCVAIPWLVGSPQGPQQHKTTNKRKSNTT